MVELLWSILMYPCYLLFILFILLLDWCLIDASQSKSKLCRSREAGHSRCRFSAPWSSSFCILHDKTFRSPQHHAVHRQLLRHGQWYIQRCKLLGHPQKIRCNKFHRSHVRPAHPLVESHRYWWNASQQVPQVAPLLGVHHFHQPAENVYANAARLEGRSRAHNILVYCQSCSLAAAPHIPCTESDAWVES